jgi:c-di-GMP-binding flagellar brake protein YcgR
LQEKRSHARVSIEFTVRCELKDGTAFEGVAKDISLGGMFVGCSHAPLPFASQISIIGQIPGTSSDARLPAIVRWTKPQGFGVQFGLLGARETHAIAKLLRG